MSSRRHSCTLLCARACVRLRCLRLASQVRLYSSLGTLFTDPYPEFLPGKRALAIGLCIYHVTCSTVLYNAPRFIPHSFGAMAEAYV